MGMKQDLTALKSNGRSFDYDVPIQGFRYHLSNLHACVGSIQISKKSYISERRHSILQTLRDQLKSLPLDWIPYNEKLIPFMNVCLVNPIHRDGFRDYLSSNGIQTGVHWKPGHFFSLFKNFRCSTSLANTELLYRSILSLPLYPDLSASDIALISDISSAYFE